MFIQTVLLSFLSLASLSYAADNFEAELVDNPVKKTNAVFKFNLPANFEIDKAKLTVISGKVKYKFKTEDIALFKRGSDQFGEIPVNNLAPGNYEVKIKLIDKKKNEHWCKFKKTKKDTVEMTIDASLEVADPGEEGKKTLAGIDSDNNHVRDDIQRFINESYSISESPSTNKALKQKAKQMQAELLAHQNKVETIKASDKNLEAQHCLWWIKGKAASGIRKKLAAYFHNTEERIIAHLKAQENLRGTSMPTSIMKLKLHERNQLCDFSANKEQ